MAGIPLASRTGYEIENSFARRRSTFDSVNESRASSAGGGERAGSRRVSSGLKFHGVDGGSLIGRERVALSIGNGRRSEPW